MALEITLARCSQLHQALTADAPCSMADGRTEVTLREGFSEPRRTTATPIGWALPNVGNMDELDRSCQTYLKQLRQPQPSVTDGHAHFGPPRQRYKVDIAFDQLQVVLAILVTDQPT